jgi:hypothetical protein
MRALVLLLLAVVPLAACSPAQASPPSPPLAELVLEQPGPTYLTRSQGDQRYLRQSDTRASTAEGYTATQSGGGFGFTCAGADPYCLYGSNANSNMLILSNVSAANAGATCGTAMTCVRPVNALDITDYVFAVGNSSGSAQFSVTHGGVASAATTVVADVGSGGSAFGANAGAYYCMNGAGSCSSHVRDDGSGNLELSSLSDSVRIEAGSGTARPNISGVLSVNTTAVGNVGASGPDDLQTYTVPASTLVTNGHCLRVTAKGTTANNANAKTVRLAVGATPTAVVTKQLTASVAGRWKLEAIVCRTGSSTQDYSAEAVNFGGTTVSSTDGASVAMLSGLGTLTETETNTLTIKTQSTVSTADNDIVSELLVVEFL